MTYLLAIGRDRLTHPERETIQIPVYLGDSLQWQEQSLDLWSAGNLVIRADDKRELFDTELRFPDDLLEDAARFDDLVNELAKRAARRRPGAAVPSLAAVFQRLAIPAHCRPAIEGTFRVMCRLHDEGRDHIWGYYVRNLARPIWLAKAANRVDVLVGNPPWLAYRNMTTEMQATFRRMSEARGLWAGSEQATHQDLAGLFAARACQLYVRDGGRFGLVMPNTAIDRDHYRGFRTGRYGDTTVGTAIAFAEPWDLRRIRPHFFPRAASVVFGTRVDGRPVPMPETAEIWTGRLPKTNASWEAAEPRLKRSKGALHRGGALTRSPYAHAFAQGATFTPHFMFVVERQAASALGIPAGRISIKSSRSTYEKKPWRSLPDLAGVVESEFVRPCFNGDDILPYLAREPGLVVLPCNRNGLLAASEVELSAGYSQWWEKSVAAWEGNRSSDRLSLTERLDYQSGLSKQFPIPSIRVVYNRAGMHVVAAKVIARRAIIANGLYWASVQTEQEADYLCAILNAPVTTELVRPFMSYGKDERDIHKAPWELPIPRAESDHVAL